MEWSFRKKIDKKLAKQKARQTWHLWFAWFPVIVFTWIDGPFGRMPFKATHWAWLRTVSRRKVKHGNSRSGPNEFPNMSSEYVETFDILRLGGVQLSQL